MAPMFSVSDIDQRAMVMVVLALPIMVLFAALAGRSLGRTAFARRWAAGMTGGSGEARGRRLQVMLVTNSGRSAWFVGMLLLMVYMIFAMTLYLLPPRAP